MQTFINYRLGLILMVIVTVQGHLLGQIPTGTWRDHLPYTHGDQLAEYGQKIFCSTSDGSLFSYNMKEKSIKKHSKVNGLSDAEISAIGSSSADGTFIIGYSNGNIDLIKNDSVINIPDIKRKAIVGDKAINKIHFSGPFAYLACDFGIVLCDLLKKEIKETYFFGPNGSEIHVNGITSDEIFIYAATNSGIFKARREGSNLLDFNSWQHIQTLPEPVGVYRFIAKYRGSIYTLFDVPNSEQDRILVVSDDAWEYMADFGAVHFEFLGEQQGNLIISTGDKTYMYNEEGLLEKEFSSFFSKSVWKGTDDYIYYAASFGGLVRVDDAGNGMVFTPDGPAYRDVGDIEILNGKLWAAGGTFNSKWKGYGAYSFVDEKWIQYNSSNTPALANFLNISEFSIDPSDDNHIIGGSFGYGIVEIQDGEVIDVQDETDGVLKPVTGYENQPGYVRISGTDIGKDGTAYASSTLSETAVYKKVKNGNWQEVQLNYDKFGQNTSIGEILIDSKSQLWLILSNTGVLVFTESEGKAIEEKLLIVENQEGEVFDFIYSIAEDKDNNIWIGTNKGPVYYSLTNDFFSQAQIAEQPAIPRNDGSGFASLLLASEQINDIEIDGANRKWFATEKSGVFLISPDGKKEIYHFTEENSPLFSNSVQTVSVNDKSGEVFFGTEKGLISFRAGATEGGDDFGDVYVFPNPVREDFEGDITITGLAGNVNVKITDISGNLVFETNALGGQAIWNGRDFNGNEVHTGIYLVFCTNEDGTKTHITKFLKIH